MLDEAIHHLINHVTIEDFIRNYYRSDFRRGWAMADAHSHPAMEIDYVEDGAAFYKFDKEIVKISKNNLLVILPYVPHQLFVEYDCKLMHVSLNMDHAIQCTAENAAAEIGSLLGTDPASLGTGYLQTNDDSSISDSIKKIIYELENKEADHELMVKLLLSRLLIKIKRIIGRKKEDEVNVQSVHVEKAINYITLSLPNDLTPETISGSIHISCDYLKHIFKKYTGFSVMEYVANKRIELAKQLMENSSLKVSDIAMNVGIGNFQYFSTLFRKQTGVTPSQYRRTHYSTNYNNSVDGKTYHKCTD